MLKKTQRLTKKKDFDYVFKIGRSSYDQIMGVKAADNKLKHSRFGIVVSTKVGKKAVERNKIKRQIREIIRTRMENIISGQDCMIIARPLILNKSYQEIDLSISKHFKRLKIYK